MKPADLNLHCFPVRVYNIGKKISTQWLNRLDIVFWVTMVEEPLSYDWINLVLSFIFLTCMEMHNHQSCPVFYLLRSCDHFNQSTPWNGSAAEQTYKMAESAQCRS